MFSGIIDVGFDTRGSSTTDCLLLLFGTCAHVSQENKLVISIRIIVKQRKEDIEVEFEILPTHTIRNGNFGQIQNNYTL